MKLIIISMLLCGILAAQSPELKQRPLVPTGPTEEPVKKPRNPWLWRSVAVGTSVLSAKAADDCVDGFLGPRRAMYVGAGAFATTLVINYLIHKHRSKK